MKGNKKIGYRGQHKVRVYPAHLDLSATYSSDLLQASCYFARS